MSDASSHEFLSIAQQQGLLPTDTLNDLTEEAARRRIDPITLVLQKGLLSPMQVEIVERVCSQFSELFVMQKQASTGCHFWFDLGGEKAPARLADRLALSPSMRFFGPGNAAFELDKLGGLIKSGGAVPSNVNLGGAVRLSRSKHPVHVETRRVSHCERSDVS